MMSAVLQWDIPLGLFSSFFSLIDSLRGGSNYCCSAPCRWNSQSDSSSTLKAHQVQASRGFRVFPILLFLSTGTRQISDVAQWHALSCAIGNQSRARRGCVYSDLYAVQTKWMGFSAFVLVGDHCYYFRTQ